MIESDSKEIFLYGVIGPDFFDEGISQNEFKQALDGISGNELDLFISSPGGDVDTGISIINQLERWKGKGGTVNVFIDSIAASMGSGIAMSGDTITMADNALMMIHAPYSVAIGNAEELRATADVLDKYQEIVKMSYMNKAGLSSETLDEIMKGELWMTATEAKEQGFVDAISGPSITNAKVNDQKFGFKDCPDSLKDHSIAAFKSELTRDSSVEMVSGYVVDHVEALAARQRLLQRLI